MRELINLYSMNKKLFLYFIKFYPELIIYIPKEYCIEILRYLYYNMQPDNVLIHEDGTYKICDFGWAIPLESDQTYPPELCGTN